MDSAPKGTGRGTATWPEEQLSAPAEVPTANSKGLRDPPGPGAGAAANSPAPGGCTGWVEAGRAHNETKPHPKFCSLRSVPGEQLGRGTTRSDSRVSGLPQLSARWH